MILDVKDNPQFYIMTTIEYFSTRVTLLEYMQCGNKIRLGVENGSFHFNFKSSEIANDDLYVGIYDITIDIEPFIKDVNFNYVGYKHGLDEYMSKDELKFKRDEDKFVLDKFVKEAPFIINTNESENYFKFEHNYDYDLNDTITISYKVIKYDKIVSSYMLCSSIYTYHITYDVFNNPDILVRCVKPPHHAYSWNYKELIKYLIDSHGTYKMRALLSVEEFFNIFIV